MGAITHSDQVVPARRQRRRGHTAPNGQFFTLPAVARFVWEVVDLLVPAAQRRVLDLAAGDGVLLDEGCRGGWVRPEHALGLEIDTNLARRRDGRGARIEPGDGLLDGYQRLLAWQADVVVGNPPFGRSRDLLTDAQLQRLATEPGAPRAVWGARVLTAAGQFNASAGSCRVEELFLERALSLLRDGGVVAYVLPDGALSNRRAQVARDWLVQRARLLAAIALPSSAFRRAGLNALAHLIVVQRRDDNQPAARPVLMMERRHAGRGQLPAVLAAMLQDLRARKAGQGQGDEQADECGADDSAGTTTVAGADLPGRRWDPGFWIGRHLLQRSWHHRGATILLGDAIELLTYGPIVTGGQPLQVDDGIASIRQGDFSETGLRSERFVRVLAGSAHDPARSRVAAGDLLMPRSGGGALGRNRIAVYEEREPANIGCFVNLIRLASDKLNPYYLWFFLRSRLGWGQIRALINGVGTPNISFAEIRSLQVPYLPACEQQSYERAYTDDVAALHRVSAANADARTLAEQRFGRIVRRLDERLSGGPAPAA